MTNGLEKENDPTSVAPPAVAPPAKKDRHVVTWTPREDDLLREHIALHGTAETVLALNLEVSLWIVVCFMSSWRSIAALLNDKTSRQCRRR
ncbi:hypothetical protein BHE74_00043504 [Ensete ventricosum]|nr:hypothetical protein GW17_00018977 [Ensete ventricosum]RWW50254.1 hypothetical protein BHE74_00043504 [Ensete ventricosum]RZR87528.1 hypothetical protein BHM03_00014951 [Ensete ventricosum]